MTINKDDAIKAIEGAYKPFGASFNEGVDAAIDAIRALPDMGLPISTEVLNFLNGAGEIDGISFGDRHPNHRGLFWWRKLLPPPPEKA